MSDNRIDNPRQGPQCKCCGTTWERLDDTGHYYQCEECGAVIEVEGRK
jgi:DNA-directed RNA polymerase subunit RPC12/RpoP